MIIDLNDGYELAPFDPVLASNGYPTAIQLDYMTPSPVVITESLDEKQKSGSSTSYYIAEAEEKKYSFNDSGNGNEVGNPSNNASIYLLKGTIAPAGGDNGDTIKIVTGEDPETHQPTYDYYNLTSLNFRESVAVEVLNALINKLENPMSYKDATIKLLVDKAFQFSKEFTNQAINLRQNGGNAEDSGQVDDKGRTIYTIDDSSSAPVLSEIAIQLQALNSIKKALDGTGGSTDTTSVAKKLADIVTQSTGIKTALDGSGTGTDTVAKKLATIATAEGNINTSIGNINTSVGNIHTDLSGVTTEIRSGASNIKSGTDSIAAAVENKVTAPAVVLVVEGTVDPTMAFTPLTSGQATLDDAITAYQNGQHVMLKYGSLLDTITYADLTEKILKSQAGALWEATPGHSVIAVGQVNSSTGRFMPTQGASFSQTSSSFKIGVPVYLYYNSASHPVITYGNSAQGYYLGDSDGIRWIDGGN